MKMTIDMYKNLTDKQKINILIYERGQFALLDVNSIYDDTKINPPLKLEPVNLYISSVLGINYQEFKEQEKKEKISWKFEEEMRLLSEKVNPKLLPDCNIIDMINNLFHSYTDPKNKKTINQKMVQSLDKKILKVYHTLLSLINEENKKEETNYQFVKIGVSDDGETLYKKVKKST